jgi:guanine deaminase
MSQTNDYKEEFLLRAIRLAGKGIREGAGGPFGCVIVKDGALVAEGFNEVIRLNDPTAHAEIVAIRHACRELNSFQLTGCDIYASCEPCPMCLGAVYWARPARLIYANTRGQASAIGFDDGFIYDEITNEPFRRKIPFIHRPHPEAENVFAAWKNMDQKTLY